MIRWPCTYGELENEEISREVPSCICVEPDDGIIVTARLSVLTLRDVQGEFLDEIDVVEAVGRQGSTIGLQNPDIRGIAASGGRLLLSEHNNACCVLLSSEENGLSATILYDHVLGLGPHSSTDGSFCGPQGCTFGNDQLLCCDTGNHRVNVFDAQTGSFMLSFGSHGNQPGEFEEPVSIALDETSNEIYVLDQGTCMIHVFNGDTFEFKRAFGEQGTGKGQFERPSAIAILPCGAGQPLERTAIVVADQNNDRIQVVSRSGKGIWVCDSITIDMGEENDSGEYQQQTARFKSPFGVAVDSEGDILVADWGGAVWITPYEGIQDHAMERELETQNTDAEQPSVTDTTSTEELDDRGRTLNYEELMAENERLQKEYQRSQRTHISQEHTYDTRAAWGTQTHQETQGHAETDVSAEGRLGDLASSLNRRKTATQRSQVASPLLQPPRSPFKLPANRCGKVKKKRLRIKRPTSQMLYIIVLEQGKSNLKTSLGSLKKRRQERR
eukprot:gb/GECG01012823.1/.p1 GENE.gb/GECG01012823.1/~~gb/GECG01012823.1/.p1  ORF type:complete len:500 (+),score=59.47 gb/GECG01012823.1/:1-1500(+)